MTCCILIPMTPSIDMKLCRPDSQKADSRRKGITFSSQELSQTPRKLQAMKSHPLIRDNITINCCSELSPSVMTRKHFFFGLLSLFLVLSFGLPRRNQLPDTLPKKRGLHIWRKKKYFFPNSETTRCIKKELVLRNDEYSFFFLLFSLFLFSFSRTCANSSTLNRRVLRKASHSDSVEACHHLILRKRFEIVEIEPASCECRAYMRRDQPVVQRGSNGQF